MQDFVTFLEKHPILASAALLAIALLFIIEFLRAKRKTTELIPTQAVQMINREGAIVIDLRPIELFKKGHIIDAISLPLEQMNDQIKKIEKYRGKPLIIVCTQGLDSQKMAAQLYKQGYNVYALAGGMRAWLASQLPVIKESK